MPYPWPSFGTFQFNATEKPSIEDDSGWVVSITAAKGRALGAVSDSITVMALGSRTRNFSIYLAEDRLAQLQALIGSVAAFCDWSRPTPDSRNAFLDTVEQGDAIIRVGNSRGLSLSDQRRKVRVTLTSQ
jgi:hypothetical protein